MTQPAQLTARAVHIHTPTGRPLFRDLHLSLIDGERVAIIGRNGTGKTTLLNVLAGELPPTRGQVQCSGTRLFVPQLLTAQSLPTTDSPALERFTLRPSSSCSPGEHRRQVLEQALGMAPRFLLLDEPSLDLDRQSVDWLTGALQRFDGGCLMVSHDRRLLRLFNDFFVVSESGCQHHHGDFDSLLAALSEDQRFHERKYAKELHQHVEREAHHVQIARRRERKKNVGRIRELKRSPARISLNNKRGYAQVSQAKRARLQESRITATREWVKSVRRSLAVELPLEVTLPSKLSKPLRPIVVANGMPLAVGANTTDQVLDLQLSHERWAITGPNGCGKSTLLRRLLGVDSDSAATQRTDLGKIGYIAQNASNWQRAECLLELLCFTESELPHAAQVVAAHRFPVALAERPLASLSPGERVRAALLALSERQSGIELLVLDEPTSHLDLLATTELERILRAWPGGLLVVSHDEEFLSNIGIDYQLSCENARWQTHVGEPLLGNPAPFSKAAIMDSV